MPDEPDKPGGEEPEASPRPEAAFGPQPDDSAQGSAESGEENERPTVSPPFDPIAFAKEILRPSPAAGLASARLPGDLNERDKEHLHTKATPPQGTEQQAADLEASRTSGAAAVAVAARRRKTPTSTLSLANARIPSNLPPRLEAPKPAADGPPKHESLSSMNAVDREWADLEIATRPPPADGPGEDPVIEIVQDRLPRLDLDEVDLDEHSADTVRRPVPEADFREVLSQEPPPPHSQLGGSTLGAEGDARPEIAVKPREREMNDRVSLGDYSGALEIAEKILEGDPEDPAAKACADNCRTVLRQMYATRIGPLDRVPIVMVPRDQLRWLSIDHKAGFVLSLVDGVSSLEMIIDVSGMPELDTLRILSELAQQRIISLR